MDSLNKETALIEAILFLESEFLSITSLSQISDLPEEIVTEALKNLEKRYSQVSCGLELSNSGENVKISPKREYCENLKDRYGKKNEGKLSRAAMETLSIIAYRQPITKAEIKDFRMVNPDNMIQMLKDRQFIKKVGNKDVPGKPTQYGTTLEFLKHFRLNTIADLPKLNESDIDRFELKGDV